MLFCIMLLLRQAVESQVNLEKLQQEAHAHNLHRKEVKELYQQVRRCSCSLTRKLMNRELIKCIA